jgi:hypothetical protein
MTRAAFTCAKRPIAGFCAGTRKPKTVERLNVDWSPVEKYFSSDRNAAWEGIAIHGSTMYVANERKKGRSSSWTSTPSK